VKSAATTHYRKVSDIAKARDYHDTARELASEAQGHELAVYDKEKINLEIHAERQSDDSVRLQMLELARGVTQEQSREMAQTR